jgi:DNA-binding response OmpR family regulator
MTESAKTWEDAETLARNKTKILVVDDERAITEITAAILTADGYFVETTTNGDVAFDLYCQYLSEGQPFDFVLTGLKQPGMNGIDLIQAILKKKPDQRFGFSTAYPILPKPFERSQLLAFVRQR